MKENKVEVLTKQLEALTGKKVVLQKAELGSVDEDLKATDWVCEMCEGEGFTREGRECPSCKGAEDLLAEKGVPVQFFVDPADRKKLKNQANSAGFYSMSEFLRNKLL